MFAEVRRNNTSDLAKKWQCLFCLFMIGMVLYMPSFIFKMSFGFSDEGNGYVIFATFFGMFYWVTAPITLQAFVGWRDWRLPAGLVLPAFELVNIILVLIWVNDADWEDDSGFDFQCGFATGLVTLMTVFLILAMYLPTMQIILMLAAIPNKWNPRKIAEREDENQAAAQAIGVENQNVPIMDPNQNNMNYMNNQNNMNNPNQPAVIIIEANPQPMNNQYGFDPYQNYNQNVAPTGQYVPAGPSSQMQNTALGQPINILNAGNTDANAA